MAFCPFCKGEMGVTELVCPHCGFDFPEATGSPMRATGFAYSPLADTALTISMIAAGLGCIVAVLAVVVSLLQFQLVNTVLSVVAFFLQLGMLVVFLRVSDLTK
jgi:hypothetical protein